MDQGETLKQQYSLLLKKHPKKVFSSSFATIRVWEDPSCKQGHVYFIHVSKNTAPLAVKRNLLRRRYREILKKTFHSSTEPLVIQCQVKKPATHTPFLHLQKDVEDQIHRQSL